MKLLKNFVVTLKSKGTISTFLAVKNFFFIKFFNTFSSSEYIKKKIFTYKMYLDPKDKGISRTLLLFGERELDHKIIIEKVLKKKMKIFDIGANIGYYVLMESLIIGKKGEVVALEPVPSNMKLLNINLKLNKNNITKTMQLGLSNSNEQKNFLLSEHSNLGHVVDDKSYKNKKKLRYRL